MKLKDRIREVKDFFQVELWSVKFRDLTWRKKFVYKFLRVLIITVTEFKKDRIREKASNLTYFTLLSIVPVIAMAFGISKGFGMDKILEGQLGLFFASAEVLTYIMEFANKAIETANGGVITGIGIVVLLYTVINLLNNIEVTFNVMWDIKKHRPIHRKLSDYISVMILGLVLLFLSSGVTVFIASQVTNLGSVGEYQELKTGISFLVKMVPYMLIWLLLFLLYLIFPNTRVKVVPALVGGIVAGTAYQLTQWGFITFQFAFSRYNAIYGSLALLPLFLIYIQLSWFIVLIGAEIAYALQHYETWVPDNENLKMSLHHKKKIALIMMYRIIKRFEMGEGAITIKELSGMGSVPYRFVGEICYELEKCGLLIRSEAERGDDQYIPAFDINRMDIYTILNKYESDGLKDFDKTKSHAFQRLEKALVEKEELFLKSNCNVLLKDL
jgi:membrane protein